MTVSLRESQSYTGRAQAVRCRTARESSRARRTYNAAGLLETLEIQLADESAPTVLLRHVDYTPWGQRRRVVYGNGVETHYAYERHTRRLSRLMSVRAVDGAILQDLEYSYDPAGNIVEIRDRADQSLFFAGPVVGADSRFRYDGQGRLIEATGREHPGQAGPEQRFTPAGRILRDSTDACMMRRYRETYEFDAAGNIAQLTHVSPGDTGWVRHFRYAAASNQMEGGFVLDLGDNLQPRIGPGERIETPGTNGRLQCTYNLAGRRLRKALVDRRGELMSARLYLSDLEIYRQYDRGARITAEWHTRHIMEGSWRIALIEKSMLPGGLPLIRYQLANHQGSPVIELDGAGQVLSYEEYHPYGTTAYYATSPAVSIPPKRYRFTGKERDEETGLCYHGARYYAPWLARWTSPDPAGPVDGPNLFAYVRHNPLRFTDPTGLWGVDMHFAAVYWTGRAFFNHEFALSVAIASQSLDDHDITDPPSETEADAPSLKRDSNNYCVKNRLPLGCDSELNQKANNSHALGITWEKCHKVVREGIDSKRPLLFGLGMHTVGDFLPHANLSGEATAGHQIADSEDGSPSTAVSTWADDTFRNPRKALNTIMRFVYCWGNFKKAFDPRQVPRWLRDEDPDWLQRNAEEEKLPCIGNVHCDEPKKSLLSQSQVGEFKDFVRPPGDYTSVHFTEENMKQAKIAVFRKGLKALGALDWEIQEVEEIWKVHRLVRRRIWAEGKLPLEIAVQTKQSLFSREERQRDENRAWEMWTSWPNNSLLREGVTDYREAWGCWTKYGGDWSHVPEYEPPVPKRFGEHPFHAN
jgi:RHS repeat-associated protein